MICVTNFKKIYSPNFQYLSFWRCKWTCIFLLLCLCSWEVNCRFDVIQIVFLNGCLIPTTGVAHSPLLTTVPSRPQFPCDYCRQNNYSYFQGISNKIYQKPPWLQDLTSPSPRMWPILSDCYNHHNTNSTQPNFPSQLPK